MQNTIIVHLSMAVQYTGLENTARRTTPDVFTAFVILLNTYTVYPEEVYSLEDVLNILINLPTTHLRPHVRTIFGLFYLLYQLYLLAYLLTLN